MFTETNRNGLTFFSSDNISCAHAFSTRLGGVSVLPHLRSLNLGENRGDDPENVKKNYDLFLGALGLRREDLVLARQIASCEVRYASEDDRGRIIDGCDGFVTDRPGIVLGVKTADCVPILYFDRKARVIGAAHAGWRGAVGGIAAVTVERMKELGASADDLEVALGPAIMPCCYEVGEDFRQSVINIAGEGFCEKYVKPREGGKYTGDLIGMNLEYLRRAGIKDENISVSGRCTCHEPGLFFSHRYGKGQRGVMCSVIAMK